MKNFRDLNLWEKAHDLTRSIYLFTKNFPQEELYGITIQIRRAAVSIPTNIAEGCGRASDSDFKRFLQYSMGSACELEYLLLLSLDLSFLDKEIYQQLTEEVVSIKKMLSSLIIKLRADSRKQKA